MINGTKFMGSSFYELIEYFDLKQKELPFTIVIANENGGFKEVEVELFKRKEKATLTQVINGNKIQFEIEDAAEVELIKLKNFLKANETNKKVINTVKDFMEALIEQSQKFDHNAPGFKGILEIEDDSVFMAWVIDNVANMWT